MAYFDKIPFVPGLELSERLYFDIVQPLLNEFYPKLTYTACRLGYGSDVLGLDTEQSRDHDWGPKLDIFLDSKEKIDELDQFFNEKLRGKMVSGYSTQFKRYIEPDGRITLINTLSTTEETIHGIRLMTVKDFFLEYLNWSIDGQSEVELEDWLTFPCQHLLTIARGRIFYDSCQLKVEEIRSKLSFYPDDVHLYLMASLWNRLGQEQHLMSRAGQVRDELGSSLIASRLVRDIMRLIFLLERQYFPYPKWFGTGFSRWTRQGAALEPILFEIQTTKLWQEREKNLAVVYERLAELFSEQFPNIKTKCQQFYNRPFRVIDAESISEEILKRIQNPFLRQIPKIGGIDLFVDSADALSVELRLRIRKIFS